MRKESSKANSSKVVCPTCFCLISGLPLFTLQRTLLESMHSTLTAPGKYTLEFYVSLAFHHLAHNGDLQNEVQVVLNEAPLLRYRNYKSAGFVLPNFTVQTLLEHVKPKHIMQLVNCLLFEKKLILIRDNCNDNARLIEALLVLLAPLYFHARTVVSGKA